jgi:glycosyltransferase involved in cell wall biosynthesis
MKVLHVIPSISERSGGPSQAIIPMCRSLGALGVGVVLATTNEGVSSSEFRVSSLSSSLPSGTGDSAIREFRGVRTICFPKQLGRSFKYSRPFAQWLEGNVSDFDIVHIHAVFNHASIAAARACRKHKIPYIIRPLGTLDPWSMKQKSLRKKAFWLAGVNAMVSSAAAVHYTARAEQEGTELSLGVNHGVVVPLGVELPGGGPKSRVRLAATLPLLGDHPYVLVLSRLLPTKGIDVLLQAFLELIKQDEFVDWRLVLAGEGPADYVDSLRAAVSTANASEQVLFAGWLGGEEKDAALSNAALLALPSYHENFGLCVIEAMAYGVPVVVSPQVNLAPDIQTAGAGWVAEIEVGALRAALTAAFSSPAELARRGAAGRKLAGKFEWSVIAGQLTNLYSTILSQKLPA